MEAKRRPYYHSGLQELTDTILVVQDVETLVNRKFIASKSDYFERLLCGSYKEGKETRVELKGWDPSTFFDCMDIIHGIPLECAAGTMDLNRLSHLISTAKQYFIPVVEEYAKWELSFCSEGNEVDRYLLACHHDLECEIKEALFKFVTKEMLVAWFESPNYKDDIVELKKVDMARLFSMNYGCVPNCENASLTWNNEQTERDRSERKEDDYSYFEADVLIDVEGTKIGLNRNIFSYVSSFFYKLFTTNRNDVIPLPEVKLDVFIECLDIFNHFIIKGDMSVDRLYNLLDLSTRLCLEPVRLFCYMEMLRMLHANNNPSPTDDIDIKLFVLASQYGLFKCKNTTLPGASVERWNKFDFGSFYRGLNVQTVNIDVDGICDVISNTNGLSPKTPESTTSPLTGWRNLSTKSQQMDIAIEIERKIFYVNQSVLSNHSSYFYQLLESGEKKFELEDVNPEVFLLCLNIIHGKITETFVKLRSCHILEILKYAQKFKMPIVKMFCDLESSINCEQEINAFLSSLENDKDNIKHHLALLRIQHIVSWIRRNTLNANSPAVPCKVSIPLDVFIDFIDMLKFECAGGPMTDSGIEFSASYIPKGKMKEELDEIRLRVKNTTNEALCVRFGNNEYILTNLAPGSSDIVTIRHNLLYNNNSMYINVYRGNTDISTMTSEQIIRNKIENVLTLINGFTFQAR